MKEGEKKSESAEDRTGVFLPAGAGQATAAISSYDSPARCTASMAGVLQVSES